MHKFYLFELNVLLKNVKNAERKTASQVGQARFGQGIIACNVSKLCLPQQNNRHTQCILKVF